MAERAKESDNHASDTNNTTAHAGRRYAACEAHQARQSGAAVKAVAKPAAKLVAPPEPVLYKLCKPGWAVIVERIPNALGTRFVCPFCPKVAPCAWSGAWI